MKIRALALFVLVGCLAGCALFAQPTNPTPQDLALKQVTDAEAEYIFVTTPIDAAIADGDIRGHTATDLQAIEAVAWNYIMAAHDAAKAGKTVDTDAQLQLFKDSSDQLLKAFAKNKPPATRPG